MSLKHYIQKIRFIDHLVEKRVSGTQEEFAKRMNVSVSTLNAYLSEMREAGFPIKYCHKKKRYYYEREGKMVNSLFEETLSDDQMKKIEGGAGIVQPFYFINI